MNSTAAAKFIILMTVLTVQLSAFDVSEGVALDQTLPQVTAFKVKSPVRTMIVPITAFTASDPVDSKGNIGSGIAGYKITTTATPPASSAAGWSATPPVSYTFATSGIKTLYAWVKDGAGNVSAAKSAHVIIDQTKPIVTAFTPQSFLNSTTVPIALFTASDAGGSDLAAYMITESSTPPTANSGKWSAVKPTSYTVSAPWVGQKKLYAWAKDKAGNVSAGRSSAILAEGSNILPVTVNGSLCSAGTNYPNKPCVSVTVCSPGGSPCQTISDILLDTGSTGLRIFKQVLTVPLTQVNSGSDALAECVQFGDGSSDWGPVKMASVVLGNEPGVQVPIQVIDSTFGTLPTACGNADKTPAATGFNGILGVGLWLQDCGSWCTNTLNNREYYSCSATGCKGSAVELSSQVQNPVALLPNDSNGVILKLPVVPLGGAPFVKGSLVLGIGTQANNTPAGVTAYSTDSYGEFTTTFNGISDSSFIDSGSNALYFSYPSLKLCSGFFCPASVTSLSAKNTSASGSPSGTVKFQIGNSNNLWSSPNNVFIELGGSSSIGFDWGLPFFFGRDVYVGFEGNSSPLGNDTYWAY